MHNLFVHCSAVLLEDTPSIGATCVVWCTTASFLFGVISTRWFRAPHSPVVHADRDPRLPVPKDLPVPLFRTLVGPLPCSRTSQ